MQTALYDQYAMAALTGLLVDNGGPGSEGVPIAWACERASTIAIEMMELHRQRADKIRELEAEYLDGLAVDRK